MSRVTACRKCAESSLLPRFVHVSFSWWIDRLIVPGNVLPPFSYSILDSSAPISGVIKTHELFRFFLYYYFILFLTHKKVLGIGKRWRKKKHVSPVGLFFVHFSSIFSSYVFLNYYDDFPNIVKFESAYIIPNIFGQKNVEGEERGPDWFFSLKLTC